MKQSYIREIFWPLMEKENPTLNDEECLELKILDESLDTALELNSKIAAAEEDRRKSVEGKAALLLSTISIATSVIVAANALVTVNKEFSIAGKISVSISFVLTIYTLRTVWFAIKALERGAYQVLDFNDINIGCSKSEYKKTIIMKLRGQTIYNQRAINKKVDWLTLSQEYYKRSLIIISLYALVILIYSLIFSGE